MCNWQLNFMVVWFYCKVETPVLQWICNEAPMRKQSFTIDLRSSFFVDFDQWEKIMILDRTSSWIDQFQFCQSICLKTEPFHQNCHSQKSWFGKLTGPLYSLLYVLKDLISGLPCVSLIKILPYYHIITCSLILSLIFLC